MAQKKVTNATGKSARHVTLAIDIGGTGVKIMALDEEDHPLSERLRLPTPDPPTPTAILRLLNELKTKVPPFDRVAVGFPGVIKQGRTMTAANLCDDWINFPLAKTLEHAWGKPVRLANDCAVQGYAAIEGHGVELMFTLGTGLGSAIFTDGHLCPGLELAHHPWRKKTYEDYLGKRGLKKYGVEKWNRYLKKAIAQSSATFNWDKLYIGGGNAAKITLKLPEGVKIVPNEDGLIGGGALWRDQP